MISKPFAKDRTKRSEDAGTGAVVARAVEAFVVTSCCLVLGVFTRISLVCGAVFMMVLTIGVTSNQQWDLASQQLLYSLIFFLLLYLIEHNAYALDNYMYRSSIQ